MHQRVCVGSRCLEKKNRHQLIVSLTVVRQVSLSICRQHGSGAMLFLGADFREDLQTNRGRTCSKSSKHPRSQAVTETCRVQWSRFLMSSCPRWSSSWWKCRRPYPWTESSSGPRSASLTFQFRVKNYPGIIERQPQRSETNRIAERAVRRVKEETASVLLQSGLGNEWWADSMECFCYLRNTLDKLSDGKTPYERRFGNALQRTNNSVWSDGRVSPYLCKRPVATASVRLKNLARFLSRLRIVRGRNLERRHHGRRHWRNGGDGCIWTPHQKAQCKGSVNANEKWKLHFPVRRWNSTNLWENGVRERPP